MSKTYGTITVIRRFLQEGESGRPVTVPELKEFKDCFSNEEWVKVGFDSAELLGLSHVGDDAKGNPMFA